VCGRAKGCGRTSTIRRQKLELLVIVELQDHKHVASQRDVMQREVDTEDGRTGTEGEDGGEGGVGQGLGDCGRAAFSGSGGWAWVAVCLRRVPVGHAGIVVHGWLQSIA
jgi:hypothetical protein